MSANPFPEKLTLIVLLPLGLKVWPVGEKDTSRRDVTYGASRLDFTLEAGNGGDLGRIQAAL